MCSITSEKALALVIIKKKKQTKLINPIRVNDDGLKSDCDSQQLVKSRVCKRGTGASLDSSVVKCPHLHAELLKDS